MEQMGGEVKQTGSGEKAHAFSLPFYMLSFVMYSNYILQYFFSILFNAKSKNFFYNIPVNCFYQSYLQCTRGQAVGTAEYALLLRYFQSAYVQYASFKCLAEMHI